jgi:sulfatase maturation enzyme AslB (radical SAM superfamily)
VSESQGILKDPANKALQAGDSGIAEARNNQLLKEIRLSMLRGERHPTCIRCNREDDSGIRSRRTYERDFWRDRFKFQHAVEHTQPDGSVDTDKLQPGYLDLRFGNLCNLKCRMCGPTESSRWIEEYFETESATFEESFGFVNLARKNGMVFVRGGNPYDWHKTSAFWEDLSRNLGSVRKIYFVGGEPLLIDRHYDVLTHLVDSGRSGRVIIQYNTNLTVVPPRALDLWRKFKEVRVGVSVDGHERINNYIRYPSRWETIEKNLSLLDQFDAPIQVWIATTVQLYNIYYLTDFLRWKIERGFRRVNSGDSSPFLTLHPLHNPPHFSVQALPEVVKQMVSDRFDSFFHNWFVPFVQKERRGLDSRNRLLRQMEAMLGGYRTFMWKEDLSSHLPEFWRRTKVMDAYRKERFEEVMPEIAGPISEALGHVE